MKELKSVCDSKVFELLYNKYAEDVYGFMFYKCGDKSMAEDFVQESFVKMWSNCKKVIFEKSKSYLFMVANNLFISNYRHQKVVLEHQKIIPNAVTSETPEYVLEEQEFLKKLQTVIGNLSEKQREVFLMNRIDKKKYKEIALELNISIKTVEKRMSAALKEIRTYIKGI
ncbi:RNA polymerase sigma factor [Polaribacter staleyi]|uniref:RNA polymerase sigma factor n=1 Tax=Polaribacter staleyi TaxID=2022337 RepID=UPI0031BAEF5D